MKIIVNGACGRMGCELAAIIHESENDSVAAFVDKAGGPNCFTSPCDFEGEADVIIDFSHHTAAPVLADFAAKRKIPLVLATTGHTEEEISAVKKASETVPVFMSANMSVGVAVLSDLVKRAVLAFPEADVEIIEKHHNRKLDAPSGTALLLANTVKSARPDYEIVCGREGDSCKRKKNEIGVHSLRMGSETGEHEVIIATDAQILTLTHRAQSRAVFAEGALSAARFIVKKERGLFNMQDLLKESI